MTLFAKYKDMASSLISKKNDTQEGRNQANSLTGESAAQASKNWYNDRFEWMLIQRNLLFVILIVAIATIVFLNFSISFIKSTKSIEPFVIEIEPKTGVPTVVQPLSAIAYTANEAINRYFVWSYVTMREEYSSFEYVRAMKNVRLFSSDQVFGQYRRAVDQNNLQSPYNLYGTTSTRIIELKSLIMQDKNTAQVRIRMVVNGTQSSTADKIVLMRFTYDNLEISDEKRLVNPLGFTVLSYRIDNERL